MIRFPRQTPKSRASDSSFGWARQLICLISILASVQAVETKPNILLILSDDHSVPHVGCYGNSDFLKYNITPNLDAFAGQGMRFDRAYTAAPQCAPSRISIFASQSPVKLGVTRFAQPARADVPFFTDILRENGYWVGLDGRHQHLDGRNREAAHIDEVLVREGMRNLDTRFDHFVRAARTRGKDLEKVDQMVALALESVPEGKPFFLYFGFNQPHRRFGPEHEGIDPSALSLPPDWPDTPEVRLDYARYIDDVRELDYGFGMIMDWLEAKQLKDNTLVVFMGDNGEALLRGKGTLLDRGTHVPLIIRWPGMAQSGSESDLLISGIDLAPTLLQAAGMSVPEEMDGVSFLPELLGRSMEGRDYVYAERGWHWGPITRTDGLDFARSVTSHRYRLIYNVLPGRSYTPVDMPGSEAWISIHANRAEGKLSELHERLYFQNPRPIVELYDLEKDPYELDNLAESQAYVEIVDQLQKRLEAWMISQHDYLPLPSHALRNEKDRRL